MTLPYHGCIILLTFSVTLTEALKSAPNNDRHLAQAAVKQMIARLIPGREDEFEIVITNDKGPENDLSERRDSFEFHSIEGSKLQITASSSVAAAWGFNHFLKYFCKAHISWSGSQLRIPYPLPKVSKPIIVTSPNRYRYYQNVCTSSYSFVWWNWSRWEKEIDWMALNGINMPLAFVAQEEIWRRVYIALGVSQAELDEHFAGPAFLAWGRMGNMRGWGGPLPYPTWYQSQLALQHKILNRMRDFGMIPVLPGFAGHVPAAIKSLYPSAKILRLGDWGRFNSTYCCTYFLDPSDSLFQKVGAMFIAEQIKEYNGTNHIYNADSFNEMTPPSSDPSYLASSSRAILSAMQKSDPYAIWLMQGWLFRDRSFWKPAQVKALLTGVPIGKMIVLDLFAEVDPIWKETESFYGQPFIWCMLHNFGGNLGLYGTVERVVKGPVKAHSTNGSSIIGTGMAPEGIEQNDFIYELMAEMGWRSAEFDLPSWTAAYSTRRYGKSVTNAKKAWYILLSTVYNCSDNHADHNHGIPVSRPALNLKYSVWYTKENITKAWGYLVAASSELSESRTYRYDLVDVGRQVLQDISYTFYFDLLKAYENKDINEVKTKAKALLTLFLDLDALLSSDDHFLLGNWLENAKNLSNNAAEQVLYEFNARNQITMWGPDDNIHDYANKMWGGLTRTYYYGRWYQFCDEMVYALTSKQPLDMKKVVAKLLVFEHEWNHKSDSYPVKAKGDSIVISKNLYEKYVIRQKNMQFHAETSELVVQPKDDIRLSIVSGLSYKQGRGDMIDAD